MISKSKVVNLKSNYGIPSKIEKNGTSQGDVTRSLAKKRGVYVDRRDSHSPVYSERKTKIKAPPRPKAGQKKFLSSVLTILSKSTTGTQYPEGKGANVKSTELKSKTKRHMCKSKTLNKNVYSEDDQFLILQSKKDIVRSPSVYSDANTLHETDSKMPKVRTIKDFLATDAEIDNKEVVYKKIKINEDPETLVTKLAKCDDDGKLYNLFVDILQSTFDEYNLKEDEVLTEESKTDFGIDESVAKRLIVNKPKLDDDIYSKLPKTNAAKIAKHEKIPNDNITNKSLDIQLSDHRIFKISKPKITAQSFMHRKKSTIDEKHCKNKKTRYNSKKKLFLNSLKEELQTTFYKEPQNFFQTLKVMAENKNKEEYKKSLSFINKIKSLDSHECMNKGGDLIILKSRKVKNRRQNSEFGQTRVKKNLSNVSNHSLEITELNYEEPYREVYENYD